MVGLRAGGLRLLRITVIGNSVAIAALAVLVGFAFWSITGEGAERRDETCRIDEKAHLADVKRLERTYAYLGRLPRSEWGSNFTREIVLGMPALEEEARLDRAPAFCDEPGVGLPEPDPKLPRFRNYDHLLRPAP